MREWNFKLLSDALRNVGRHAVRDGIIHHGFRQQCRKCGTRPRHSRKVVNMVLDGDGIDESAASKDGVHDQVVFFA